ncbi:unnamed protein product, partial [Prorocentrum cordatum]
MVTDLPIDFKNRCNVGYGFINFRTSDACEEFVSKFNGVDVRKCLPGLNSRKVAEVTPARVQGLDENVRRLRNGPVMNELAQHPELAAHQGRRGAEVPHARPALPADEAPEAHRPRGARRRPRVVMAPGAVWPTPPPPGASPGPGRGRRGRRARSPPRRRPRRGERGPPPGSAEREGVLRHDRVVDCPRRRTFGRFRLQEEEE